GKKESRRLADRSPRQSAIASAESLSIPRCNHRIQSGTIRTVCGVGPTAGRSAGPPSPGRVSPFTLPSATDHSKVVINDCTPEGSRTVRHGSERVTNTDGDWSAHASYPCGFDWAMWRHNWLSHDCRVDVGLRLAPSNTRPLAARHAAHAGIDRINTA